MTTACVQSEAKRFDRQSAGFDRSWVTEQASGSTDCLGSVRIAIGLSSRVLTTPRFIFSAFWSARKASVMPRIGSCVCQKLF